MASPLKGKRVLLGVTGGIAAYKAALLTRLLVKAGADVHIVMTPSATKFIGTVTLQTLSKNPLLTDLFDPENETTVPHVELADAAELAVLAPATAETLSAIAHGSASDALKAVFLAVRCPTLIAPAMNVSMWQHPAVADNVSRLRAWGYRFVGPEEGDLAEGYSAMGRMSEPETIVAALESLVGTDGIQRGAVRPAARRDLAHAHVLITAGPTREHIDPVRFLSNPSSGRMGYALASVAAARGATVTLVSGPTELPEPPGVTVVNVTTAREMLAACEDHFENSDAFIATAAVADYRPKRTKKNKTKKTDANLKLDLIRNPDILATLAAKKEHRVCVGFAAETTKLIEYATAKLTKKNLDFVIANEVGPDKGLGASSNTVTVIDADGVVAELGPAPKVELAEELWSLIAPRVTVRLRHSS